MRKPRKKVHALLCQASGEKFMQIRIMDLGSCLAVDGLSLEVAAFGG